MPKHHRNLDAAVISELQQVMGDSFPMLVETFLNDSEVRIDNIVEALSAKDAELIRRAGHSFKGSAANMGATELSRLCKVLEDLGREGVVAGHEPLLIKIRKELAAVKKSLMAILG